jgi:hypothetical protein
MFVAVCGGCVKILKCMHDDAAAFRRWDMARANDKLVVELLVGTTGGRVVLMARACEANNKFIVS